MLKFLVIFISLLWCHKRMSCSQLSKKVNSKKTWIEFLTIRSNYSPYSHCLPLMNVIMMKFIIHSQDLLPQELIFSLLCIQIRSTYFIVDPFFRFFFFEFLLDLKVHLLPNLKQFISLTRSCKAIHKLLTSSLSNPLCDYLSVWTFCSHLTI